jgi:hypothetical protein
MIETQIQLATTTVQGVGHRVRFDELLLEVLETNEGTASNRKIVTAATPVLPDIDGKTAERG